MTTFKFHEQFTLDNLRKFPKGWILRTDLPNYAEQSSITEPKFNLVDKIIFVDPGIWGDDALKSQYWKGNTYHPSLSQMSVNHVKKNTIFIGKIILKKEYI